MKTFSKEIDGGKPFDWGRISEDYAKYRDIYPEIFYEKIIQRNLCIKDQRVLDLGTGTGVLPRHLYPLGAEWVAVDQSENQILQAKRLSAERKQKIRYEILAAEELEKLNDPNHTFDVITACQCFWYFQAEKVVPQLLRLLKKDGRFLLLYMAYLPLEDKIAGASEELILKHNPNWTGAGETRHFIFLPACVTEKFEVIYQEECDVKIPFTRETWNGRMKACRGIGASLSKEELQKWEKEHKKMLEEMAPEKFEIQHYIALSELKPKEK